MYGSLAVSEQLHDACTAGLAILNNQFLVNIAGWLSYMTESVTASAAPAVESSAAAAAAAGRRLAVNTPPHHPLLHHPTTPFAWICWQASDPLSAVPPPFLVCLPLAFPTKLQQKSSNL